MTVYLQQRAEGKLCVLLNATKVNYINLEENGVFLTSNESV